MKSSSKALKRKFSVSTPSGSPLKRFRERDEDCSERSIIDEEESARIKKRNRDEESALEKSKRSKDEDAEESEQVERGGKKRRLNYSAGDFLPSSPSFSSGNFLSSPLKKLKGPSMAVSLSMSHSVDEDSRRFSRSASNESLSLGLAPVEKSKVEGFTPLLSVSPGWINETGFTKDKKIEFDIERQFVEPKWYATYFLGKEGHMDFVGVQEDGSAVVVSIVRSSNEGYFKTIVRSTEGTVKHEIFVGNQILEKLAEAKTTDKLESFYKKVVKKYVLGGTASETGFEKLKDLKILKGDNVKATLQKLEEQEEPQQFKFGVFYAKEGQTNEDEMFQNHGEQSASYSDFLSILGTTINLQGFDGYDGGLDTSKGNRTGKQSVFTAYKGFEIMYHVATMLPFTEDDEQQLDKKRHLGNDVTMIVFLDRESPNSTLQYSPATIKTHFNHVLCVVSPAPAAGPASLTLKSPRMRHEDMGDVDLSRSVSSEFLTPQPVTPAPVQSTSSSQNYFVQFSKKESVPDFGPELPSPPLVVSREYLRDVLLCKLINGEIASYEAPSFKEKLRKTRTVLLNSFKTE
eukprot:TRINITY_DN9182_c0_g1_i1.p1 TRINITY_DN9182_c0_g1~~TRINITY_DN9182_c0_g1_i1.p1  ORF type:complete len:639 (-),score=147.23 TRINITY_DN9182_c0_g1_i1:63-1781(-)